MKILITVVAVLATICVINLVLSNFRTMEREEETARRRWIQANRLGDWIRRSFKRPMRVTLSDDELELA